MIPGPYYVANYYRYLLEYTFHDYGMIGCRSSDGPPISLTRQTIISARHAHAYRCWRFETGLGDPSTISAAEGHGIALVSASLGRSDRQVRASREPFIRHARGEACEGSAPLDGHKTSHRYACKVMWRKNALTGPIAYI